MRHSLILGLAVFAIGTLSACDSFVEDVDQPIDRVDSDSLDQQREIDFLITGLKEGFNDAYDNVATISELLSDNAIFNTRVRNSTFPTYGQVDAAEIEFDNNTVDGVSTAVNEYRFLSDDLLRRIENTIEFSDDDAGAAAEQRARFAANYHGAVARYFLATYFSEDGQNGGAPISTERDTPGPVIPAADLYQQAQDKLALAVDGAPSAFEAQVANSLRARIALLQGDRAQAAAFAAEGLTEGDAPDCEVSGINLNVACYNAASQNNWFSQGGRGRTQISINPLFADLDAIDNRDLVETAPNASGADGNTYYRQGLYTENDADLPFLTWQEMALIQAENALLGDGDEDAAKAFVNPVLVSRSALENPEEAALGDGESFDQDALIDLRRRELFTQGLRLVDQRRFGIPFTRITYPQASGDPVETTVDGAFRYLPLTQTERNANPNF